MPPRTFKLKSTYDGLCIGIDPGKSGGIALLHQDAVGKDIVETYSMPETELAIYEILDDACAFDGNVHCFIERAQPMVRKGRSQGSASAFTFGKGYGFLLGCLTALRISFQEVTPKTWIRGLNIPISQDKAGDKLKLLQCAQRMFPKYELWKLPKTKGKQLAVCDALLIAEFCRRTHGG